MPRAEHQLSNSGPRVQAIDDNSTWYAEAFFEHDDHANLLRILGQTDCAPLPSEYDHVMDLRPEFHEQVDRDGTVVDSTRWAR